MAFSLGTVDAADRITGIDQLEALYGKAVPGALKKEIDHISPVYRAFIEKAPFVVVATCGPEGLDCSPRGDPPGFVRVVDEKTVLLPDRRGNNRLDTLRNIVRDGRISLLFLIPGVGETLRINGRAEIVTDADLCASFAIDGKAPRSVVAVTADRVYYQCQKALARSRLWSADAQVKRSDVPTAGQMLATVLDESFDPKAYDDGYPDHMKKTIY
jgi:PPOX class probable FMN-dependent enzyme